MSYSPSTSPLVSAIITSGVGPPNCGTPQLTTISAILGVDGSFAAGGFAPGIPEKHTTSPPCIVNGVNEYVIVRNVRAITPLDKTDCILGTNFCDVVTDITDDPLLAVCPPTSFSPNCLHIEIDQTWEQAGFAPPDFPLNVPIDVWGWVFWDADHWEIHPVAGWQLST